VLHSIVDFQVLTNIFIVFLYLIFYRNFGYYGSKMVAAKISQLIKIDETIKAIGSSNTPDDHSFGRGIFYCPISISAILVNL
jgi:hypothetical protein